MADYDERTINTYDTYGQDTFAEASVSESGPSPDEDEFTQYGDPNALHNSLDDSASAFTSSGKDEYTTDYTDDPRPYYDESRQTSDPTKPDVDGPYYDEDGRPYYIDEFGEPYYDDSYTQGYDESVDTGDAMMTFDPDMQAAPDDDDEDYDYDYDEGVPLAGDHEFGDEFDEEFDEEDEAKRRARRRRAWCCCLIMLCCMLILIILLILYLLKWENEDGPNSTLAPTFAPFFDDTDDDFFYDDDITLSPGFITSCMADYLGDCDAGLWASQACFPNVVDQCNCNGEIRDSLIPGDVQAMRELIMDRVAKKFFGDNFTMPLESCDPINMAMIWLASGNNRDAGEARQRFSLAVSFYGMNGTIWDYTDAWMSELNECLWLGVQCNNRDSVNSLQMDTNNIFGGVSEQAQNKFISLLSDYFMANCRFVCFFSFLPRSVS
jgi:hypothetical protein